MKIKIIKNLEATVLSVSEDHYVMEANRSTILVPRPDIEDNPRVPLSSAIIGPGRKSLDVGTTVSLVKITFINGQERYALNEKVYCPKPNVVESKDITVAQLILDLSKDESENLEFKSSAWHPADPENKDDHTYQMREIIKQLVAGANSKGHSLRLYVGVSMDKPSRKYYVSGLNEELVNFGDKDQLQARLTNMIKQLTSPDFLLSLQMRWINYFGKLVLCLDVDHSGDVVLYGRDKELYVRFNSTMQKIDEASSYIRVIREYKPKALARA